MASPALEGLKAAIGLAPTTSQVPRLVEDRIGRGRNELNKVAPSRNEALEFWRGNQYWYVDGKGVLQRQPEGGAGIKEGKASHRVREPHNMLLDFVAHEVSAATRKVPAYEISPTTTDPEDIGAARLAEKVASYGYDKWGIRRATVKAVTYAVVADEAFAWPYWDSSVGPFIDGENIGVGDVRVNVYAGNQVYWEPGQQFEDSDWHAIDIAMTPEAVQRIDGYSGPQKLTPDADTLSQVNKGQGKADTKMVLVTYYLERPSALNPDGSWMTLANGSQIADEQPYPGDGDEPCLHHLSYITDPDSDRDMGLVRHLLTAQRTYNDAANKIAEWKNLHLMGGRLFVSPGALRGQKITDQPGAVYQIHDPNRNVKVWEAPPVPQELFEIMDRAQAEMARIAAQNDIPSQVESGKAIGPLLERDDDRRYSFLANLAEFHSKVMRACLVEVQENYTEPRLLTIKGRYGWENIQNFYGAHLRSQCDVRVSPGSLEPQSRAMIEQKILAFADRLWISPQAAMHAINTGTADKLIEDVDLSVAKGSRLIEKIKEGPQAVFSMPPRIGPEGEVPGWMPQPWDNIPVLKSVFETWFQTEEAEKLPLEMQEVANLVYGGLVWTEQQQAIQQAEQQQMMAEDAGMQNAAKSPPAPSQPDRPALGPGGPTTQNQPNSQSTTTPPAG